jgi:hypothetical protein
MHGNKKLCRIFLGKCTTQCYENLTTKKPPSFATRGLFVWLIIQLLGFLRLLFLQQVAFLQSVFEPGF